MEKLGKKLFLAQVIDYNHNSNCTFLHSPISKTHERRPRRTVHVRG